MSSPSSEQCNGRSKVPENPCSGDQVMADYGIIELHLRKLKDLFDSLDPSPFREKDLDRNAEE